MVVFFIMEILPIEVTAMGAVGILLLFNVLTWQETISGFSNPAVITIGAIFIMSRALVKTGFKWSWKDFVKKHVVRKIKRDVPIWIPVAPHELVLSQSEA